MTPVDGPDWGMRVGEDIARLGIGSLGLVDLDDVCAASMPLAPDALREAVAHLVTAGYLADASGIPHVHAALGLIAEALDTWPTGPDHDTITTGEEPR